jgi:hypothetical protein
MLMSGMESEVKEGENTGIFFLDIIRALELQGYKRDHGNSRRVLSLSEDQEFKILVA